MTTAPDQHMIDHTLRTAAESTCRSKRGVALYDMRTGAFRGAGFNGPPQGCPGRAVCAGTCGQRSVHAEMRALREAAIYRRRHGSGPWDLIHVELAADGGVVACDGPSCWQCSREILDVGFVGGVWLYEGMRCKWCDAGDRIVSPGAHLIGNGPGELPCLRVDAFWHRYTAEEFYRVTLRRCGMTP